ncbi:FAD-dependent oxidoreductase domain-containing protein 2-like [Lingula anatina]|uniref:FAD-dependent oxidoreductase domain-containing protein 2-like n=1 Tax=Lingula anatina TaxID=7574 RepID=A0A1S3JL29_LINAN|nr:FAD-dependent oxidoreductase domain-containing protein 2-like [Lingula anatina]|eukprot:XP_013411120.1 FAD-dependent oxidoreductase domain-containing protein 2-like [Lingula anatina]
MLTNTSGFLSKCVLLVLLCLVSGSSQSFHEYCIVGAGPGGLQLGYFLKTSNRDYVIFERNNVSGSFFTKYPRHDMLISINKRNTGKTNKEFNLRHDWNSLISHDESLQVRHYSKVMFPHREVLVKYLGDYQRKLGINVQYNVDVHNIRKRSDTGLFSMEDQRGNAYSCKNVIIATGLQKEHVPQFRGVEYTIGYNDVSINPDDFEGKSVLIIGRGNSAFEVADRIYGATNVIHMIARSRVRLSWATHYVGDLRAVNNGLLDTYQLKSLDAVLEAPIEEAALVKTKQGKIKLVFSAGDMDENLFDNFAMRDDYDVVIRCTGWKFDDEVFHNSTKPERGQGRRKKFPKTLPTYESTNIPGLFFAGTNSHSVDFRKSAGGFIHGFRYTARTLYNYLEHRNHGVEWPSIKAPITELLDRILKRINEASGIYQMFQVLGDVILLKNNGREFEYLEEFPIMSLPKFHEITGKTAEKIIVVVLEYGANFSGPGNDVFRLNRATGEPSDAHQSNFLHPVFYYYETLPTEKDMKKKGSKTLPKPVHLHHIVEDFLTTWDAPLSHILPLRQFLERCIGTDMRKYFASSCFTLAMTHQTVPLMCQEKYMQGQGLVGTEALLLRARIASLL